MMIESLEDRRLMATTVAFVGGVVFVTANSAATINVVENSGAVHVDADANSYDFAGATAVNVNGSNKNDLIFYTGNTIGAVVNGNDGNDNISVDDEGTGSSAANGGKGNDSITVIHGNNTNVNAGDGDDQVYVNTDGSSTSSAIVDLGGGKDSVTTYGGSLAANGGAGKDTLIDASGGTAIIASTGFEVFVTF